MALRPDVEAAVAHLERATAAARGFDPATATRSFRVAMADYQELTELPRIFAALRAGAPGCSLEVVPIDRLHAEGGLERGAAELALGPRAAAAGRHVVPLYEEHAVMVVRRDHPWVGDALDAAGFARLPQVVTQVGGRPSVGGRMVEEALRREGQARAVSLRVPHFVAAARVVVETDAGALIPGRLAALLGGEWPLRVVALPFALPRIPVAMAWTDRTDADPGAAYLRAVVRDALG
ncbi:MAG: LysR substrate-binding domain-containing protein [Myxococcota bacterium]